MAETHGAQRGLLLSFLAIGVYWLCHHYSGRVYAKTDYVFSVINLGFLLAVTVLPYPLRIWCFHLGTVHEPMASRACDRAFPSGILLDAQVALREASLSAY